MVSKQHYRDAMARLGASVSVITTDGPAGRRGFTASAVCSVTDDPPTLLVCCNRANDSHAALLRNGVMCVNALSAHQATVSDVFAGIGGEAGNERFATGDWDTLETGAPALRGAAVSFDCRIVQVTEVGTHSVLFGAVARTRQGASHDGLMYFGRSYHPLLHRPAG